MPTIPGFTSYPTGYRGSSGRRPKGICCAEPRPFLGGILFSFVNLNGSQQENHHVGVLAELDFSHFLVLWTKSMDWFWPVQSGSKNRGAPEMIGFLMLLKGRDSHSVINDVLCWI